MARLAPIERIIADRIRALRERQGLTQGALARLVGTSRSQVVALESGDRAPTIKTLESVARVLGVALPDLVAQRDPAPSARGVPDRVTRIAELLRDRGPAFVEAIEQTISTMDALMATASRRLGRDGR